MSESDRDFEELLARVRQGDGQAFSLICERYSEQVRQVVRRRLNRRLRRRYDSTDFVQAVWTSFVQLPKTDCRFENSSDLVAYLSRMASNKVIDAVRRTLTCRKHGAGRETSLNEIPQTDGADPLAETLHSPAPTPSQVLMADERWQQLLALFPEGHRRILELLREGYSPREITASLGIHPKVVQRLISKLRVYTERT